MTFAARPRFPRRHVIALGLCAALTSVVAGQTPVQDLAKPPATARHFIIQSTGGRHGESWMWDAPDGTRMGRESMNLRGQVFELDSSGTAGPDGLPSAITIRGVTPQGDAAETFTTSGGTAAWKSPVDAGTATTFDSVRPNHLVKGFDRVLGQMQKLAAVKRGALGYSFLIIQRRVCGSEQGNATAPNGDAIFTNAHEIGEAARRAKEIGCDYFEYKPMVDSAHYLMPFSEDLRAIVREQDAICRRLETDDFAIIAPASMELLSVADDPRQPKKYATCPAMELRTLVTPSGVYPCPYHRGREDKRLGPVPEMPFDIWWQSDERKRAMARTDPRTDCNFYCIRHRTNVVVHALRDVQEEGVDLLSRIERSECPPNDPFF